MSSLAHRALRPATWAFYVIIVLEFLFMISPMALTFYSGYQPVLAVFHASPWTAWLTSFFLPHFSETSSPLLNSLSTLGFRLAFIGMTLFVVGALQIYGAKVFRRGAVKGGLYRWVRHPQYLALAILGLGVTLVWARFLVLVTFVTMILLYSLLSRWEEKRLLALHGEEYEAIRRTTGMYLPRSVEAPFRRVGAWLLPWSAWKVALVYLVGLGVALSGGVALREATLNRVSSYYAPGMAVLSPAIRSESELAAALELAGTDENVSSWMAERGEPVLVYVVPENWFLPDLPLHSEEEIRRVGGGHGVARATVPGRYTVLFTRIRTHFPDATGKAIVRSAYAVDPYMLVDVDLDQGVINATRQPPEHVIWGDIPTPRF